MTILLFTKETFHRSDSMPTTYEEIVRLVCCIFHRTVFVEISHTLRLIEQIQWNICLYIIMYSQNWHLDLHFKFLFFQWHFKRRRCHWFDGFCYISHEIRHVLQKGWHNFFPLLVVWLHYVSQLCHRCCQNANAWRWIPSRYNTVTRYYWWCRWRCTRWRGRGAIRTLTWTTNNNGMWCLMWLLWACWRWLLDSCASHTCWKRRRKGRTSKYSAVRWNSWRRSTWLNFITNILRSDIFIAGWWLQGAESSRSRCLRLWIIRLTNIQSWVEKGWVLRCFSHYRRLTAVVKEGRRWSWWCVLEGPGSLPYCCCV